MDGVTFSGASPMSLFHRAAVAGLAAVVACSKPSVAPAPATDTARVTRDVTAIENRIGDANFACDYKFFAAIEAPEFLFTDSRGGITTRAEDLAGESSCRPRRGTDVLLTTLRRAALRQRCRLQRARYDYGSARFRRTGRFAKSFHRRARLARQCRCWSPAIRRGFPEALSPR